MSFDVHFQGFRDGEASAGGGELVRRALEPFMRRSESADGFLAVEYGDGSADVYLSADRMMANHVVGDDPWQLLVASAATAGWVILPAGCPTCITDEAQRAHLPDGIDEEVVLVTDGTSLVSVFRASE